MILFAVWRSKKLRFRRKYLVYQYKYNFKFPKFCRNIKPSNNFLIKRRTLYPQDKEYKYKECDEIEIRNSYGKQKFIAEQLLNNFSKENNIELSILRIASAYGFDSRFSDKGVINKWIYYTIINKKLTLYNSVDSKINFISFDESQLLLIIALIMKLTVFTI